MTKCAKCKDGDYMNRPLKFRAWDKNEKKFIKDSSIYIDVDDGAILDMHKDDFVTNIALSQYTRLKDKNGKEIYSSDIVKCYDFVSGKPFNCVVSTEAGFYGLRLANNNHFFEPLYKIGDTIDSDVLECQVIGNIYENPELMNEIKE